VKDNLSKHKKVAWKAFSDYIRTRDCLLTTGTAESGKCFTCKREYSKAQLQAGHFIDGRKNAVLFSYLGCHAQCYACNVRLHGNKIVYWQEMEKMYGRGVIDALIVESKKTIIYKKFDYDRLAKEFKELKEELNGRN